MSAADTTRADRPREQSANQQSANQQSANQQSANQQSVTHKRIVSSELASGTRIDHYVVLKLLGRGGMGEVYLARDTTLGRNVALKIIPPEMLGDSVSVEQFLFEARATARFNHPNIVTVYGVGEHRGRPYVALAYLEGETLRERAARQRLNLHEALETGLAIGRALVEAHRHGIVHRDLKPANVLITGADSRVQVVDFGIAKQLESVDVEMLDTVAAGGGAEEESIGAGTPMYMAPEQWRGEAEAASDVWALGVILFELCSGERPFAHDELAVLVAQVCDKEPAPRLDRHCAVPAGLGELVARCLDKAAHGRPSAADVVAELAKLIQLDDTFDPFPGLEPLGPHHAAVLFGRENELKLALERLAHDGTLAVTGPPGSGKTSLVMAGVIPRLDERLLVVHVRPGSQPFVALAEGMLHTTARLRSEPRRTSHRTPPPATHSDTEPAFWMEAVDELGGVERLAQRLADNPERLAFELGHFASEIDKDVLLFVDQLEDLPALVDDDDVRARFVRALESVVRAPIGRVRVVLALCDAHYFQSGTIRTLLDRAVTLAPPTVEQLSRALREPLRVVGYRFSDSHLVEEMVATVAGERAALALLQLAARRLWERRDARKKVLERASYEEMGGAVGALSQHAQSVLAAFTHDQLRIVCAMMVRLVASDGTRALIPVDRLLAGLAPDAQRVLHRLIHARLCATSPHAAGGTAVELSHHGLIDELVPLLGRAIGDADWWERARAPVAAPGVGAPRGAKRAQLALWIAAGVLGTATVAAVIFASRPEPSATLEAPLAPAATSLPETEDVATPPTTAQLASSGPEKYKRAPSSRPRPRPRAKPAASQPDDLYETRK